jgi:hypothetical protein
MHMCCVHGTVLIWSQMGHEGKSAVSFCCLVATWVPHMFCNFYLVKNHKKADNSTTKDREKYKHTLESSEFQKIFDV